MRDWIEAAQNAVRACDGFVETMRDGLATAGDEDQRLLHGFAWYATTAAALSATAQWALGALERGSFAAIDALVLRIGFGEYLGQIAHGVAMSQSEIVRPAEFALVAEARVFADDPAVARFLSSPDTAALRRELAERLAAGERPCESFGDETLDLIRDQFRAFTATRIAPHAHRWHLEDALIPLELVDEMAALGVFGVCIAEDHGGLGLGKLAMALVSEELSRGWICAGSLGTRSEIAGELIGAQYERDHKSLISAA